MYFFTDHFRAALVANQNIMNTAKVKLALFRYAPSMGVYNPKWTAARTVAELTAQAGWTEVAGITGYPLVREIDVGTRLLGGSRYVMFSEYAFSGLSETAEVRAIGVVYVGTLNAVVNPLIFVTNTPLGGDVTNIAPVDALTASPDTTFPDATNRWLFGWGTTTPEPIEGPLVLSRGSPEFEVSGSQHAWLYPQRANMIANPSFEKPGAGFWSGNGPLMRTSIAAEPAYLTPTVGFVTTPDPGPVPTEWCIAMKARLTGVGTAVQPLVNQWPSAAGQRSWLFELNAGGGLSIATASGGTSATANVGLTSVAQTLALGSGDVLFGLRVAAGRAAALTSTDNGATWQEFGTPVSATFATFDSNFQIMVGGRESVSPFLGRIYSVELRTGTDPAAGAVLWRFDPNEYSGSGTSYTDPRGRTWTLTNAAAITPAANPSWAGSVAGPQPGYLIPATGTASTPDTPDLTIDGDVRLTGKVRRPNTAGPNYNGLAARRGASSTDLSFGWYLRSGQPTPVGADASADGVTWAISAQGLTPGLPTDTAEKDVYVGTDILITAARVVTRYSRDGLTWQPLATSGTVAAFTGFDSTQALLVGAAAPPAWSPFDGRIYWAQMEAINRAQLQFPGVVGNYLAAASYLPSSGSLEIVARVSSGWGWASDGSTRGIAAIWPAAGRFSYLFRSNGQQLNLVWSPDGTNYLQASQTVPAGWIGDTSLRWIRAQLLGHDGAGNRTVRFDSAPDSPTEPTVWTQIGTTQTSVGPTNIIAKPAELTSIGSQAVASPAAVQYWQGRIPRVIIRNGIGAVTPQLVFPGYAGNFLRIPHAAGQAPTGDVEIVARVSSPDWTFTGGRTVFAKNGSWYFWVGANLSAGWITAGGSSFPGAAPALGFVNGSTYWVKATRVAATGLTAFYWAADSPTEPTSWTKLGADVAGLSGSLVAPANPVEVGAYAGTASPFKGRVLRAILRNGIAGPVLIDINEVNATPGVSTFAATAGGTVTVVERQPAIFVFPGVNGNHMSVPNSAALAITSDIEIVARLAFTNWATASQVPLAKTIAAGNRSWYVVTTGAGALSFNVSPDGSNSLLVASAAFPFAANEMGWVKITRSVTTGLVSFYSAPDALTEPVSWTARGTGTAYAGQPMAVSATPLTIAAQGSFSPANVMNGRMGRAIVRNGIDATTTQLRFPGYLGNYLNLNSPAIPLPGDAEFVVRINVVPTVAVNGCIIASDGSPRGWQIVLLQNRTLRFAYPMPSTYYVNSSVISQTSGMVWVRIRRTSATGAISFEWAADSATEPTSWTALTGSPVGTVVTGPIPTITGVVTQIGARTNGINEMLGGRIARIIVRNGFAGAVVLDLNESNATPGVATFNATTGGGVTVVERPPATFIIPNVADNFLSLPDTAAFQPGADIEITARLLPNAWMAYGNVFNRWSANKGYQLRIENTGRLRFYLNASGVISTVAVPFATGTAGWIRVTWRVSDGRVQFFTAPDAVTEPGAWTQLGTDLVRAEAPTVPTLPGGNITIGGVSGGSTDQYNGRMMRVITRIASVVVLDISQDNATVGATSFAATTGGTITVNQTAGNTIVQQDGTTPWGPIVQGAVVDVNQDNATVGATSFPATTGGTVTVAQTAGQTVVQGDPTYPFPIVQGPVLDVSENNAGTMVTPTTFVANTGQTVTVNKTAPNEIVVPQADRVVWRFDANDYPGTGTVYTDPRGRTWTLTAAGAIVPKTGDAPTIGYTIAESNVFPTRLGESDSEHWTVQLLARGQGRLKVGLVYWDADYRVTECDWGTEEESWVLNPGAWIHVATHRRTPEGHMAMLRLEVQGSALSVDRVLVEHGFLKDWLYFDGDEHYGARDDFSWYGGSNRQGASYSLWYNHRKAVTGRLFARTVDPNDPDANVTDEDMEEQGLVYRWVPAGITVVPHLDVLYPFDVQNPLPPKTAGILPRYSVSTPEGVSNPWV